VKGIDSRSARSRRADVELEIVGDGPSARRSSHSRARSGRDRVHFHGLRSDPGARLARWRLLSYRAARRQPSSAEALAFGTPVLAGPLPGVAEILGSRRTELPDRVPRAGGGDPHAVDDYRLRLRRRRRQPRALPGGVHRVRRADRMLGVYRAAAGGLIIWRCMAFATRARAIDAAPSRALMPPSRARAASGSQSAAARGVARVAVLAAEACCASSSVRPCTGRYPQERYASDPVLDHRLVPGQRAFTHDAPVAVNALGIATTDVRRRSRRHPARARDRRSQTFGNGLPSTPRGRSSSSSGSARAERC